MKKNVYSINVPGPEGYSFAVKGAFSESEAIDKALEADLFTSPVDADYAIVEDITNSEYDLLGLKDATYNL